MKISIIGVGRLGGALAVALSKSGHTIENLIVKNPKNAENISQFIDAKPQILSADELSKINSEIIFITTPDYEIETVAAKLQKQISGNPFVFHTAGALSSDVLSDLKTIGCKIGSIHPLVSVSNSTAGAKSFDSVYFCVEGDDESISVAERLVADLSGKSFRVPTEFKTLYHASAVMVSGHLVALVDMAIEMLGKCGLNEDETRKIFLPLIKSTVENLRAQTTAQALTGTFARADVKTFENHLQTLGENVSDEILDVYLQLGERSAHLAEKQGANSEKLAEILEKIALAKNKLKC